MEILIENGVDLNEQDEEQNTPLHKAAETGKINWFEKLKEYTIQSR